MDARYYTSNPLRPPQWRAERVWRMLEQRPLPLRSRGYDDRYVRTYRRWLISHLAASNEKKRQDARLELLHAYDAHMLQYDPHRTTRDILQARLLTNEPLSKISQLMSIDETTIIYYEKLFFDVRDRLGCRDWIMKAVLRPGECLAANGVSIAADEQRAYVYRYVAFFGGTPALDAMIAEIGSVSLPDRQEDIAPWLEGALKQGLRTRAVAAAVLLEVDRTNVMTFLKFALKLGAKTSTGSRQSERMDEGYVHKVAETLNWMEHARNER
jgi:hypothetical protein